MHAEIPLIERLKSIQEEFQKLRQPGGLTADKAYYDDLSGDMQCLRTLGDSSDHCWALGATCAR